MPIEFLILIILVIFIAQEIFLIYLILRLIIQIKSLKQSLKKDTQLQSESNINKNLQTTNKPSIQPKQNNISIAYTLLDKTSQKEIEQIHEQILTNTSQKLQKLLDHFNQNIEKKLNEIENSFKNVLKQRIDLFFKKLLPEFSEKLIPTEKQEKIVLEILNNIEL